MTGKFCFTPNGIMKLHKRIEELKRKLVNLQSQIAYVAEHCGDSWHDNPTFNSLNLDILTVNRSISDARDVLNKAVIIEPPTVLDKVAIGTRVKIDHDAEEMTWEIVGFGESDPNRDMIAYNTPLASLILGKPKGEVVSGIIAGRQTRIEILKIMKGGEEDVHNS